MVQQKSPWFGVNPKNSPGLGVIPQNSPGLKAAPQNSSEFGMFQQSATGLGVIPQNSPVFVPMEQNFAFPAQNITVNNELYNGFGTLHQNVPMQTSTNKEMPLKKISAPTQTVERFKK